MARGMTKREDPELDRRSALAVIAGSVVAASCGGGTQTAATGAGGSAGAGAGGATGGSAGNATGGVAGSGAVGPGGSAGAGGGSRECSLGTPTPGCKITDDNILGPFYKADAPFREDITEGELGTGLVVEGTVYGCDCATPLAEAIVDVWQANDAGAYDNVGYVLRGRVKTGSDGRYRVETILPGWYLNGATYRPRHIHYKVSHPDGTALTTQLYFEGDPYIPDDAFVKPSLIRPLTEEPAPDGGKQYRVTFDVVLG